MAEEDEDIAKLDAMEETSSLYHVKSLGLSVCSVSILQGRVRVYKGTRPRRFTELVRLRIDLRVIYLSNYHGIISLA